MAWKGVSASTLYFAVLFISAFRVQSLTFTTEDAINFTANSTLLTTTAKFENVTVISTQHPAPDNNTSTIIMTTMPSNTTSVSTSNVTTAVWWSSTAVNFNGSTLSNVTKELTTTNWTWTTVATMTTANTSLSTATTNVTGSTSATTSATGSTVTSESSVSTISSSSSTVSQLPDQPSASAFSIGSFFGGVAVSVSIGLIAAGCWKLYQFHTRRSEPPYRVLGI